jgi:hypothetical protein
MSGEQTRVERWKAILEDGSVRRMRLEWTANALLIDGNAFPADSDVEGAIRRYGVIRQWAVKEVKKGV